MVTFPGEHKGANLRENNLPVQLTSLVGREREIAEAIRLLGEKTRLLTLTGPGGSGKTRLVLAVAADVVGRYEDGAWLVELASLADPGLVPQAVASVLGVREQPGRPLAQTLSDSLKSKKMLLVLDNCEHLIEACAALAGALLRSCPDLRILATSREALGITGENSWPVPPLSLPDPRRLPAVEGLSSYEATRLFVERARAVEPSFELSPENAMAMVRVCHQLDGIPLAIELAVARAKVLSVEQIAERLDDCFRLLGGGSRTAMAHQRTLRTTMDWSHELLSEEERTLFRRLAIFAGGFTLEAAEAVCAGESLERDDVLDLLTRLVDKSLVLVAEQQSPEARYRLLETVRQYGWEKLNESGEGPAIRRHQAEFFLKLAERVEPKINGKNRSLWLERLEVEHGNFRAALAWSREEEAQSEAGLRLAGALLWFWFHRGYLSEGRGWLGGALATKEGAGGRPARSGAPRAKVLCGTGLLAWLQGDHDAARSRLEESVTLWRELGDKQGLAQALRILGHTMLGRGDPAVARSLAEESVELFREGEDKFGLATSLATLGIVALAQEDHAAVQAFLEESVAICRETEDDWALSLALRNLGIAALRQGDHERAATWLGESVLALQEPKGTLGMVSLDLLAAAVSMRGDHGWATRLFGAAEAVREAIGVPVLPSIRADYERGVAAARAGLGEAAFAAAWAEGRAMMLEQAVEYALQPPPATLDEEPDSPTSYPAGLSAREVEVLRLVGQGMTNARIAKELFISSRTVNAHLNSVYSKLGFNSRVEATRFAVEHDLLP